MEVAKRMASGLPALFVLVRQLRAAASCAHWRGGIVSAAQVDAAPTELGSATGWPGCYEDIAPTELVGAYGIGLHRGVRSRANKATALDGGAMVLFAFPAHWSAASEQHSLACQ
jgi:hypothetical protein